MRWDPNALTIKRVRAWFFADKCSVCKLCYVREPVWNVSNDWANANFCFEVTICMQCAPDAARALQLAQNLPWRIA